MMTLLSREEFLLSIQTISLQETMAGVRELENHLSDHDQAQREVIDELKQQMVDCLKLNEADKAVVSKVVLKHSKTAIEQIEQQAKRIQELEQWQKIVTGTGTDQEAVIRMAATEYTKVAIQSWKEKCEQQAKEITELREALQLLYDCQNGCPLPKYEADWTRAMELAEHALKEEVTGA